VVLFPAASRAIRVTTTVELDATVAADRLAVEVALDAGPGLTVTAAVEVTGWPLSTALTVTVPASTPVSCPV
jgi:hypothetical protein